MQIGALTVVHYDGYRFIAWILTANIIPTLYRVIAYNYMGMVFIINGMVYR